VLEVVKHELKNSYKDGFGTYLVTVVDSLDFCLPCLPVEGASHTSLGAHGSDSCH
jgi:hypothetical protein